MHSNEKFVLLSVLCSLWGTGGCRNDTSRFFALQDLQFEAEREAQIVFGFQVTVPDLVYQIQVAGAEFVKERDGFSLMEMIIVIAILGMITGGIAVTYNIVRSETPL